MTEGLHRCHASRMWDCVIQGNLQVESTFPRCTKECEGKVSDLVSKESVHRLI